MKKILLCITGITLHFFNILKLETFFLFVLIFHNIAVFLPKSNKFSLDEQKIFISESLIVMFPNFWQVARAASGADSASSWDGAASGADSPSSWDGADNATDLGMPAARTDTSVVSNTLAISPGQRGACRGLRRGRHDASRPWLGRPEVSRFWPGRPVMRLR